MGYAYGQSGDVTSDNTNTYLYDAEGRICAVRSEPVAGAYSMTGYLYDAEGTRVAKGTITNWSCDPATSGFSTSNDYILGAGGEQMTEMTMNGDGSALVWDHTNVWAAGKIIATYSQDNTGSQTEASLLHFYLDDPLGSRRVQTDYASNRVMIGSPASGNHANGGLNLHWSYDAFGNRSSRAPRPRPARRSHPRRSPTSFLRTKHHKSDRAAVLR